MTHEAFNKVVKDQLKRCESMLVGKGEEYAPDKTVDRLAHFKKAAVIIEGTSKEALLGMLAKHLVSLSDMITDGKQYPVERWDEKISDSINYLLLLRALVEEDGNGQN